jgi:hypothetical protein
MFIHICSYLSVLPMSLHEVLAIFKVLAELASGVSENAEMTHSS